MKRMSPRLVFALWAAFCIAAAVFAVLAVVAVDLFILRPPAAFASDDGLHCISCEWEGGLPVYNGATRTLTLPAVMIGSGGDGKPYRVALRFPDFSCVEFLLVEPLSCAADCDDGAGGGQPQDQEAGGGGTEAALEPIPGEGSRCVPPLIPCRDQRLKCVKGWCVR